MIVPASKAEQDPIGTPSAETEWAFVLTEHGCLFGSPPENVAV
jgi:hypothetical protein